MLKEASNHEHQCKGDFMCEVISALPWKMFILV